MIIYCVRDNLFLSYSLDAHAYMLQIGQIRKKNVNLPPNGQLKLSTYINTVYYYYLQKSYI